MGKQLMWQWCKDCGELVAVATVEQNSKMITSVYCNPCFAEYDPYLGG